MNTCAMMPTREPESHAEATAAADVYPRQIVAPIAVVRRAGPLVRLKDLLPKKRKYARQDAAVYRVDEKPLSKAPLYPYSAYTAGYHGSAKMASVYPYVVG